MTDRDWSAIDDGLLDPEWYAHGDDFDAFRALRDEDPVHWSPGHKYGRGFWAVTRYEDVKAVLMDPIYFSSNIDSRVPHSPERLTATRNYELLRDAQVPVMDPPLHTMHRQPMNKHFSIPAIARMEQTIETTTDQLIADIAAAGDVDLVAEIAAKLPMRVVLTLLGVPEEDWEKVRRLTYTFFAPADPEYAVPGKTARENQLDALAQVAAYATDLAKRRCTEPREDFASIIAQMEVDGVPLDDHEIANWFVVVMMGGLETTRNAIAVGMWHFLQNPEQRDLLLSDPSLVRSAVEEVLRWTTPARMRLRVARGDIELGGKKIKGGDWVVVFMNSANHDERAFDDPDAFDIRRDASTHLSMGAGVHMCLGRALARLEQAILFPKLLATFPDMRLTDQPANWIVDHMITGLATLPVTFTPQPAAAAVAV